MSDGEFSFADEFEAFGEELEGKPLPKGEYEMVVVKSTAAITQGGKQCFKVVLEAMNGPQQGRQVSEQLTWSPENSVAARIFAQGLKAMGASQEWIKSERPTADQIAAHMLGQKILVGLDEDEYLGQPRNRVRFRKNLGVDSAISSGDYSGASTLGDGEQEISLDDDDIELGGEGLTMTGAVNPPTKDDDWS